MAVRSLFTYTSCGESADTLGCTIGAIPFRPDPRNMSKTKITAVYTALLAIGMSAGCGKTETAAPSADGAQKATPASSITAETVTKSVETAATAVKETSQKAVETAQKAVETATAVTSQVQGMIDNAKKLLGENKYDEALQLLNKLAGEKLTGEQKSLVDSLKEQAQKMIQAAATKKATDEATKAVGNLFQPKK